jgi:23S rRNA pseudouridine2605 synthase
MVNPDTAHIEIDGKKAEKSGTRLIIFHKPKGVLTTKRDPEGRKTIYDVLPLELHGLHPVGRLDQHTSGLLLLTNNTRLSSDLTDPKNRILRIYLAGVQGEVTDSTLEKMISGIRDGGELLQAERAQVLKRSGKESLIELGLTEGKYREVRRLCMALGHEVRSLKRIRFGEYVLGDLKPGDWVDAVLDQAD